jgi:hypothetical protein
MSYKKIEVTPTVTVGAYSSADAVGGLLEFEDVCGAYSPSFEIVSAIIRDNGKQEAKLWLALFDRTFTPTADNAAFAVSDADLANLINVILIEDYASFNANSVGMVDEDHRQFSLPGVLVDGGTSLFGQLYVEATPTYVATDDLSIELVVRR